MTSSRPVRPAHGAPRYGTVTLYRRRRRRALFGVIGVLLLAATAVAAPRHLLGGDERSAVITRPVGARPDGADRSSVVTTADWPRRGQGAYVLGDGRPVASPNQKPVPIASVAKVMTAYLVLRHHPLGVGDNGRQFLVTEDDAVDTERRRHDGESTVPVRAGERLTEREALMAILLPSANNVAVLVARQVSGSVDAFVAEMNETARSLGMSQTTYTDPSGLDDATVSTALDQLRLAQVVGRDDTLTAMMATPRYRLPVAGEVANTNALLGTGGFVGMKTGSDRAAGGCFMFRAVRHTEEGDVTVTGVVLGQRGHNLIEAGLGAARQLVDRVAGAGVPDDLPVQQS